jgi:hypothetical protein
MFPHLKWGGLSGKLVLCGSVHGQGKNDDELHVTLHETSKFGYCFPAQLSVSPPCIFANFFQQRLKTLGRGKKPNVRD